MSIQSLGYWREPTIPSGGAIVRPLFLGGGIMIEVIFRRNDPVQVQHLWRRDPAAILAASVVLFWTPAVAEPTEAGLS